MLVSSSLHPQTDICHHYLETNGCFLCPFILCIGISGCNFKALSCTVTPPKTSDGFPKSSDGFSKASEGFPTPVTSPLRPPTPPAAQVRQYSWCKYVKKEVCLYIRTLKPLKTKKEERKLKFKRPGAMNCQNHSDVIVSGVIVTELDSDVIIRDANKPVARKRYAPKKHSLVHTKEFLKSTLSMSSQTFTKVALMLGVVLSILGGGLNIKLPRWICTSGLASVVCQECESGNNSNSARPLSLAILRESAAAIIDISKGLCSCISKVMFLNDSKQLTGSMKILQNTIRRGVTILSNRSPSSMLASPRAPYRCHDYSTCSPTTFAKNVLAGKHLDAYIFPSADFCASRVYYLDIYTVNLESDVNFTVFYDLIYLYIYTFYCSWSSCNWATYPRVILYTLAYFSLNSIVSVIRIHDTYQSLILIGLALTEKASSRIQYILFHFWLYWRGWRPLVTPWAGCIKEGIEPRIFQKRFMPSHAQVRFPLCSLLLLLLCFCFHCSYCYYYYYYYEYLLAKGFYNSSGYEYKPGHFNKQNIFLVLWFLPLFALLSSLSLLMTIMWVDGNQTYIISPACTSLSLVTLLSSLSMLMTIMWVDGNQTYIISPACSSLLLVTLLSSLSMLMTIMWVDSNQTYIISPACSSLLLVTLLSSLSLCWWPLCGLTVIKPI